MVASVLPLCGNGLCVNPEHIIPVTRSEHMRIEAAIREEKGIFSNRRKQGDKLNEEKVREMLEMVDRGESRQLIATKFEVSLSLVSRIIGGERWTHVVDAHRAEAIKAAA